MKIKRWISMKNNINDQKGTAAVEFAIILPLLVLLLFGTVEFGLLLFNQQVITNASREGARAGIVSQTPRVTDGEINTIVGNYCSTNLISFDGNNTPSITTTRSGSSFSDDLTVTVTFDYDFLVLSNLGFGPQTLDGTTLMKME
jgi:Flp pilus assembly protein TadG